MPRVQQDCDLWYAMREPETKEIKTLKPLSSISRLCCSTNKLAARQSVSKLTTVNVALNDR